MTGAADSFETSVTYLASNTASLPGRYQSHHSRRLKAQRFRVVNAITYQIITIKYTTTTTTTTNTNTAAAADDDVSVIYGIDTYGAKQF